MAKATFDTAPYINLPMTEEFFMFPEDNPGTIPLDHGRLEHLRSMSPFVLSIIPPNIGSYIKDDEKPFSGVKTPTESLSNLQNKEQAMYKPNLPTYAYKPINGARPNEANRMVQDAGITDRDQIRSIMLQHRNLLNLPPIVFAINPSTMAFSYTSRQSFGDPTRYGFIFTRWGEEQVTIEINCTIGAFIAGREKNEVPDQDGNIQGISGLQYVSRRDSLGFRNLTAILGYYRNSATIVDLLGRSRAYHAVGRQCIHYDGQKWEGRITKLDYDLTEDKQHGGIEFSMSFQVFKHTQEAFQYQSQLFPFMEPSVMPDTLNSRDINDSDSLLTDLGNVPGAVADAALLNANLGG